MASPATSFTCKSRSITTSSPFLLRNKIQSSVSTSIFRRFNTDDASEKKVESVDTHEEGAVKSAIDSVAETASTYAGNAAESLTNNYEQARDSIVDSAQSAATATGFAPRAYGDRQKRGDFESSSSGYGRPLPVARDLVPTTSIYIGNLLFDVTANDLTREFEQFGTIKSATIASDARGLSKG